jgi:hypothetical protein
VFHFHSICQNFCHSAESPPLLYCSTKPI